MYETLKLGRVHTDRIGFLSEKETMMVQVKEKPVFRHEVYLSLLKKELQGLLPLGIPVSLVGSQDPWSRLLLVPPHAHHIIVTPLAASIMHVILASG